MIVVHRPTCWNWNIGVLKKCLKSRIIDFEKLTSLINSVLKTLHTSSTSHITKKITRIDAGRKSQKSIKKSVILQILRSDFEKSLIRMIAVHRPTYWNWNIGVLKKCLKSRNQLHNHRKHLHSSSIEWISLPEIASCLRHPITGSKQIPRGLTRSA